METNIKDLTVDVANSGRITGRVTAMQGDNQSRYLRITILNNGQSVNLNNLFPVLRGTKADGKTIFNNCTITDNKVVVELTSQVLAAPGIAVLEIALYDSSPTPGQPESNGKCITAFPFELNVIKSAFDCENLISTDEFRVLEEVMENLPLLEQLDDLYSDVNTLKSNVDGHTIRSDVPANAVFTDTTYSQGNGISISGTTISNSGVRSVAQGSESGTVAVNTNGTVTNIKVKDWGTAATKNYTTSVSDDNANLVTSGAVKQAIDTAVSSVYKPAGDKTVAELVAGLLIRQNLGKVYNVTTSGTTTSNFVEGSGKTIQVGDNVAIVDIGTTESPVYKFDLLSGMIDTSSFQTKTMSSPVVVGGVSQTTVEGAIDAVNTELLSAEDDISDLQESLSDDVVTGTGNPLVINTLSAQYAQSTLIDILPIQEGSGDPSPSNIRPISGVDSASLEVCGTNLLKITAQTSTISNVKYTVNDDGTITAKPTATLTQQSMFDIGTITFKAGKVYTLSGCPTGGSTGSSFVLFAKGNNYVGFAQKIDSGTGITFGVTQDVTTTITIIFYSGYSSTEEKTFRPMISLRSDSSFEKYKSPTNLTFNFGQYIFGGTLDVENGLLTVDKTYITILWGDTAITSQLTNTTRKIFTLTARGTSAFAMCNIAPVVRQYSLDDVHCYVDGDLFALFLPSDTPNDTKIQVAYSLATTYTIQLPKSQVELLKGVNTISTDANNITMTYRDGEIATLNDVSELKKNVNDLVIGNLSDSNKVYGKNKVPYILKKTDIIDGASPYVNEKIVGGSIAWNQKIQVSATSLSKTENGVTITDNRDGSFTISTTNNGATADTYQTGAAIPVISGHKYFYKSLQTAGSSTTYYSYLIAGGISGRNDVGNGSIYTSTNNGLTNLVFILVKRGTIITSPIKVSPICIDLTLMFGSTIADYIYNLETATAGTGIAKLKEWGFFTKDYYNYDAGSIQNVCTSEKRIVGFNQWDEQWEIGAISDVNGVNIGTANRIRSVNYISCIPGEQYYFMSGSNIGNLRIIYYDYAKNFMSSISSMAWNGIVIIPQNARYMRFCNMSTDVSSYNNDICINLSDPTKNGTYEPYHLDSIALSSTELRGIPKLDTNNNLYYDGDEYTSDGNVERKYGIIDLGSLTWTYNTSGTNPFFTTQIINKSLGDNLICKYVYVGHYSNSELSEIPDKTCATHNSSSPVFVIRDSNYVDATTFKTAMSGVYLVYELDTPTTESAMSYDGIQSCEQGGTEEYVDYKYDQGNRDVEIPVGHETEYLGASDKKMYLPPIPNGDGTYVLKCVVSSGSINYSWVLEVSE